jgi:hypothetical protein
MPSKRDAGEQDKAKRPDDRVPGRGAGGFAPVVCLQEVPPQAVSEPDAEGQHEECVTRQVESRLQTFRIEAVDEIDPDVSADHQRIGTAQEEMRAHPHVGDFIGPDGGAAQDVAREHLDAGGHHERADEHRGNDTGAKRYALQKARRGDEHWQLQVGRSVCAWQAITGVADRSLGERATATRRPPMFSPPDRGCAVRRPDNGTAQRSSTAAHSRAGSPRPA